MEPATQPKPSENRDTVWPLYLAVFLVAFLFLFLGMERRCNIYDEGIVLTAAMRVAAGNVPHRDFYANYGPAEFYILAWLFKLFGPSVFVERVFDICIKAGIITSVFVCCRAFCRNSVALLAAAVCWLWLFSFSLYGPPLFPGLLLSLAGSGLLLSAFGYRRPGWRIFGAGAVSGLAALFRYDVGFGLVAAHLCFLGVNAAIGSGPLRRRLQAATLNACRYIAGAIAVFAPSALMYLAVAPLHSFVADIVTYPGKYYARARSLPFPSIHLHEIDNLAVYLPILVFAVLVGRFFINPPRIKPVSTSAANSATGGQNLDQFLILFGLLVLVFCGKGLVRVSAVHMFLSIAPSLIVLAVLFEHTPAYRTGFRAVIVGIVGFSLVTALWAAAENAMQLLAERSSVLAELISPPGPAAISELTAWCGSPNPLHTDLCFLVDANHIRAIRFIDSHTRASDRLFIGLSHHDKIWINDVLTYFATQRMPATHWYHFDPDLQSRADIQTEMIGEIRSQPVPYILLDSEFENSHEPNDSSKSSGVTLLDSYIRNNYRQIESFGKLSVWQRVNQN